MIKKSLQLIAMVVVGVAGLSGIWWLARVRPGFLPSQSDHWGFGWWKVSLGYRLLLGLDALLLAWAIGWTVVSSLTRVSARAGTRRASLALRPRQMALVFLFVFHMILPIVDRPARTPALVLAEGPLFSPAGVWLRSSLWVGGSVASLAWLVCCAGLALWHVSRGLSEEHPWRSSSPRTGPGRRWAMQVWRVCLELVCGVTVLSLAPVALERVVAEVRPHVYIFQGGSLMGVWRYVTSPTRAGWAGFALGAAALSWSLGTGILAALQRAIRPPTTERLRAAESRRKMGKRVQAWMLAGGSVLCLTVTPSDPPRFGISSWDGWWFGLDPWLAGVGLLVVALAVLFVVETALVWWDRHNERVDASSEPAATEQP